MRLKRKLQYDISVDPLWWCPSLRKWVDLGCCRGRSVCTHRHFKTAKGAWRHFNALVQQGLKPHLTRWYWKRGVRYAKDYEVQ